MVKKMRSTGAVVAGFSLVWSVACGDDSSSNPGKRGVTTSGAGNNAVGTTGTNGGGTTSSVTSGEAGNGGGGAGFASSSGGGPVTSSDAGASTSAGVSTTGGTGGAGAGGSSAGGGDAGSGGTDDDLVDCSTADCLQGGVCVPSARGCEVTLGECFEASEAVCAGGAVCGCDGVVYDDRCEAYRAHVAIAEVSECEPPAGSIACFDRFCDASTESCQVVNESRCDGGACLALCPGRHTVTYGRCIPALPNCEAAECDCTACVPGVVSCTEGADGITLVCSAGCVG